MVSNSIPATSIASASSNPKDFAKKKRGNRWAKLRQCKLDACREQWLSQAISEGECGYEEMHGVGEMHRDRASFSNERGTSIREQEMKSSVQGQNYRGVLTTQRYSDSDSSLSNSPTNQRSSLSGSNEFVANFTPSCGSISGWSSSSSSSEFFPCNMIGDEGDDNQDGCFDDWEAMADALLTPEDHISELSLPSSENRRKAVQRDPESSTSAHPFSRNVTSNETQQHGGINIRNSSVQSLAWTENDAFRPHSLPNFSRQHLSEGESSWGIKTENPTSCPICYEEFDCTDSSFHPCSCGFKLCLFCHKEILDRDERCPSCRKPYVSYPVEGEAKLDGRKLTYHLARSRSMNDNA
ncbi:uncharacterized protein LOC127246021 isoform X2 [Andrographis paniculata]|nr:uncharacterized protein LOC127246021 isoform X2 [Andrographis paniculata]